jgi:hypothetical protein
MIKTPTKKRTPTTAPTTASASAPTTASASATTRRPPALRHRGGDQQPPPAPDLQETRLRDILKRADADSDSDTLARYFQIQNTMLLDDADADATYTLTDIQTFFNELDSI